MWSRKYQKIDKTSKFVFKGIELDMFPRAAVRKNHKQSGLEQQKFIASQLWS